MIVFEPQGLEFDYVGIIIGLDLRYQDGKVITDRSKRAKSDMTIKGLNGDEKLGDRIIRNTYRTLLSRGQKGCYVFCEDKPLSQYIKKKLSETKEIMKKIQEKSHSRF